MLKQHASLIQAISRIVDVIIIFIVGYCSFILHVGEFQDVTSSYHVVILAGCVIGAFYFSIFKVYESMRGRDVTSVFRRLFFAWGSLLLTFTLFAFFSKMGAAFSRIWLAEWLISGFIIAFAFRVLMLLLLRFFRRRGYNLRQVVIVGAGQVGRHVAKTVKQSMWLGYHITAVYDDAKTGRHIFGVEVTKFPRNIEKHLNAMDVDEVWICLPLHAEERIKQVLHQLRHVTVNVRLIPDMFGLQLLNHSITELAGVPTINLRETPMVGVNRSIKWFEDKLIASLILVIVSIPMLLIAVLVKLSSSGPVFYKQERVSWNGKTFKMLKFRSMPVNTESATGAVWAKAGESRATRIGAFIRKTSLDELPQFINVLKGDMSIVGPRPERPVFVEQFKNEIAGYMQKHMVKAGITGWAQINGWRGSTDLNKRIQYDLYYIEHWSLWFDLKIIFLTIFKGFVNKNAY